MIYYTHSHSGGSQTPPTILILLRFTLGKKQDMIRLKSLTKTTWKYHLEHGGVSVKLYS